MPRLDVAGNPVSTVASPLSAAVAKAAATGRGSDDPGRVYTPFLFLGELPSDPPDADLPDDGVARWWKIPGAVKCRLDGTTHTIVPPSASGHDAVTLAAALQPILDVTGQELDLDTQSANLVFSGPVSGGAAKPTFRALVAADIPGGIGGGLDLTTKGDLHTFSTVDARLPVGADNAILQPLASEATGLIWRAAPRIVDIADTGGTNRVTTATSLPNVTLSGDTRVNGNIGIDSAPDAGDDGAKLKIAPTVAGSTDWVGINIGPTITPSGNDRFAKGIVGALSYTPGDGGTGYTVFGLDFVALIQAVGKTVSGLKLVACAARPGGIVSGSGKVLTVTDVKGFETDFANMRALASGSWVAPNVYGMHITQGGTWVGVSGTNVYGIRIEDFTGGTFTNRYLMEIGPSTPYFRVPGNFTAAANETPLKISEGATPTLRQLKTKDGAAITGGDLVCVLV